MLTRNIFYSLAVVFAVLFAAQDRAQAFVSREGKKVALVDRTGERWDITQAVSLGFAPERFQFGIGRNAIRPVDDDGLKERTTRTGANPRVIAVEGGGDARAWSVPRLSRHEIANSRIGDKNIEIGRASCRERV